MPATAAIAGLTRCVRPLSPCRPWKFLLDVDAHRSYGCKKSSFMPKHIEHPGSLHSKPASMNTLSKPSASACAFTRPEPGTTIACLILLDTFSPITTCEASLKSSILELVQDPINILSKMISQLHDEHNRITVPGFYDFVENLSEKEREVMNTIPFDIKAYKTSIDIDDTYGEKDFTTLERASVRPSLDVNGIWGGYIGEGAKTVIPSKAYAKISMRLVPNQDWKRITHIFKDYFDISSHQGFATFTTHPTPIYDPVFPSFKQGHCQFGLFHCRSRLVGVQRQFSFGRRLFHGCTELETHVSIFVHVPSVCHW